MRVMYSTSVSGTASSKLLKVSCNNETLYICIRYVAPAGLSVSDTNLLCVPRVRTCFGSRGFSVAAPTILNSLPLDIRNSCSIASFRRQRKTSLFQPLAIFSAPPHPSASDSASFSPTILCAL